MKTLGAAKFKAECLALMDEVETKRSSITITKKGKAVARLVPMPAKKHEDPLDFFFIGGEILGDVTLPAVGLDDYKVMR